MMKNLVALSLVLVAAAGCADDADQQAPIYDMHAMPSGFEVILVDAVDFRSEVVDDNLPMAPSDGDLSFAQNDDAHIGGANQLSGEAARDDSEIYGDGDLGRSDLAETYARQGYDDIDGELAHSGYSEIGSSDGLARTGYQEIQSSEQLARTGYTEVEDGGYAHTGYTEIGGTEASDGAEIPLDPCQCVDASCRQQWVEVNLGCNVCAVFSCGEQNVPHSCNACL